MIKLKHIDLITCAKYYDKKKNPIFMHYSIKTHGFLHKCMNVFLIIEFQNCCNEHDHDLLGCHQSKVNNCSSLSQKQEES
jgi:hypothetical protein